MEEHLCHIAASEGSENCILLLDYSAQPTCKDTEGSASLWEAMLGGHDKVAKLLKENGANINAGDAGHFACTVAEQNDFNLLQEIVRYGADVTRPKYTGYTAFNVVVCEGHIKIVNFFLERGADVLKPVVHRCTPRDLAEKQGHEEIKMIFKSSEMMKT